MERVLKVPDLFCFLSDAESALAFFEDVDEALALFNLGKLILDFSECAIMGICAYSLLWTKVVDAQGEKQGTLLVFAIPSDSAAVNQMLNVPDNEAGPKPVATFRSPMIRGRGRNSRYSKERDRAGTEIVDYLSKCLATQECELTADGCKYIGNLITEAVGNAEEHSGPWVACGYFVKQYNTDPGECHLVLFNSGPTIAERIASPESSAVIRQRAEALADRHNRSGFFVRRLLAEWNKESLLTLYALQEGVSSRLHERASRGNGTIQMIKAFSELAGADQRMCILSGSAYILFDGSYSLSSKSTSESEKREVIAFNTENDLELPPDDRYVKSLPRRHNGTIVSVRFRLSRGLDTDLIRKREP